MPKTSASTDEEGAHAEREGPDRRAGKRPDDARALGLGRVRVVFGARLHAPTPPVVVAAGQETQRHARARIITLPAFSWLQNQ